MNFIVSSSTLLRNLQSIGGVLSSNNSLPILDNFLFDLSDGKLTISSSDLENTMRTSVALDESKEDGTIAIPAKLLLDTLKNLPDQPLVFQIDTTSLGIEISSDYGKYKLVGQNGADFPEPPEIGQTDSIYIQGDALATAINRTLFATGNDDLRPVMGGVLFQFDPDRFTFVATDAQKLVRYDRTDVSGASSRRYIVVPRKPLNLLKQNLTGSEEVQLTYDESYVKFTFGTVELKSRLIDGKFPDYEAVIPSENPHVLTVDRLSFLNSIKRVAIFSNKTTHQVKLDIAGSELSISAEDSDFSNEAKERISCHYIGEDIEIGFHSKFLLEMLLHIDTDEVILEISDAGKAGILLPSGSENEQESTVMLVMPVMVK